MGRGTRAQPSRGRARGDGAGDGSPVPPQDDADDGERVRYHVSVPLGMWEVRLHLRMTTIVSQRAVLTPAARAQLNQTDVRRDTGSKLCRLGLARKLRLGARWVRARRRSACIARRVTRLARRAASA